MRNLLSLAAVLGLLSVGAAFGQERALLDRSNRFLDKVWPAVQAAPSIVAADSFEDWATVQKDWKFDRAQAELSAEHATDGKNSLKVVFPAADAAMKYLRGTRGWGGGVSHLEEVLGMRVLHYDELRLEVFNPGPEVKLVLTAAEDAHWSCQLKTGANSLVIPTAGLRKEVYRVTDIPESMAFTLEGITKPVTLYFDQMRWIGPGLGKNLLANATLLQFGKPYCNRPGFKVVDQTSGYTKERGFGWQTPTSNPAEEYNGSVITGCLSGRRGDDELTWCYLVFTKTPLLVDLPAGKYRMHMVEHGIGFYEQRPCMYDLSVKIDESPAQVVRRGAKTFAEIMQYEYGLDQTDWQPGDDLWKKYRALQLRPLEMDFEAKGGTCKIDFASEPRGFENLSFVILYPVAKAGDIEPELAALWRDIRYRFLETYAPATRQLAEKFHLPGLHEEFANPDACKKRLADLNVTDAQKQQGGIVFARPGVEEVYPDTIPAKEECASTFDAVSPAGEVASFAVNLFATKDLKAVRLTVGDFAGAGQARITAKSADVRVVNCIPRMTGQQLHGDWRYMVMPWHLVHRPAVDVAGQTSRRWWVNVTVPDDTPAGTYTATAVLEGQGLTRQEVELQIEVPPFRLDPTPKNIEQGMVIPPRHWGELAEARAMLFIRTWVIYSHFETLEKPEYARWKALYDPAKKAFDARVAAELAMIKKAGLNFAYIGSPNIAEQGSPASQPANKGMEIFQYEYTTDHAKVLADVAAKKAVFSPSDFLKGQTEEGLKAFAKDKKVPVVMSMNRDPFWWNDVQEEAGIYRLEAGFFLWRLGAQGAMYGPWSLAWRDPYNPTDGHTGEWGDFCVPSSSADQPDFNSTMIFEGLREGVTDYRYVAMLERLLKEKPDAPAAVAAKAYLQGLREQIAPEASHYFQAVSDNKKYAGWDNTWTQSADAWKGREYDRHRRELVKHIAAMMK